MQKSILMLAAGMLLSGATATAATRYVAPGGSGDGSSWATAMSDLQEAINASDAGDQVWVAAGVYKPTELIKTNKATSKAFKMKDGVSLYGGFEGTETTLDQRKTGDKPYDMLNPTILSADDDVADEWTRGYDGVTSVWGWVYEGNNNITGTSKNSSHVLYSAATLEVPTVIDGFTLTGANANVATAKPSGGAVYAPGKVTVNNCRIVENSVYFTAEANDCNSYGAGVYLNGGSIANCYIARAYAHSSYGSGIGGGVYVIDGTVENCVFEDCVATDGGGAVYMRDSSLKNCTISGCYGSKGGAIYNNGGTIDGATIIDCRALHGGGIFNAGTVKNVVIAGCYADYEVYEDGLTMGGGGIYNYSGDVAGAAVYNCTSWRGGGVYLASGRLINATVQNNTERDAAAASANVFGEAASVLNTISASDVAASNFVAPTALAGSKDVDASVLAAADWSLAPGSIFIDAGTPVEGYAEGLDLAGNPRVAGASIDCGAYEAQGGERVPTAILTFAESTGQVRIAAGYKAGYEFTIDWGNGEEEVCDNLAYYVHELKGNTVKIYCDSLIQFIGINQGLVAADFSHAATLQRVQIGNNQLTSLVMGEHPLLDGIYAENNKLTEVNIAGSPAIKVLDVHNNLIGGTIDCSAMYQLSKVDISDNMITGLTLPEATTVNQILCGGNQIESLTVENLSGLTELSCTGNKITSLTLKALPKLEALYAGSNQLAAVDLSECQALETVNLSENQLESVDLSNNTELTGVYVQDNKLTALDLSKNAKVRWLNFGNNKVAEIGIAHLSSLTLLEASNNALTEIVFPQSSYFPTVNVANNRLSTIDVSKNMYLSTLNVSGNNLTALNLEGNPYLYYLYCANNKLTELDVEINNYLQRIEAQGNKLSQLNVVQQVNLRELLLQSNQFSAEALKEIITDLPDVSGVEVGENVADWMRVLNISYNPGTETADVEAASAKGWFVTSDYDTPDAEIALTDLNVQIIRSETSYYETSEAEIVYANDEKTLLNFENFMGTGARIVATLDAEGNVAIAPQMCGGDGEGNYLMIVNAESVNGAPFEIANTRLYGKFDGTTLTLDPWNLIVVPYTFAENLGTYYPENVTSTFVKSNSKMEYTVVDGGTIEVPIYAENAGNGTVDVYGWGRYAMVSLQKVNGNWTINSAAKAYFMEGAEYNVVAPDGADVVSVDVPDSRNIVFGAWQFRNVATGKVVRDCSSAKLTLGFDLPDITGIDAAIVDADIVETTYYNAAGIGAPVPCRGFNIRVDVLSNGTTRTTKVVVK